MQKLKESDNIMTAEVHRVGRTIYFYGLIFSTSALAVIKHIHELSKTSNKPITLQINSPGGNVYDGFAIYDALEQSPCKIITIGTGSVESMATIVYLAGDKRYCTKNCRLMYHESASESDQGEVKPTSKSKRETGELTVLDNICNDIVAEKTKFTAKEIAKLIEPGEFYFSANEGITNGFVHKII